MRNATGVVPLGIAITTFLVVAGAVTGLLSATIEFSAILGLPAGLLAGAGAAVLARRRLGEGASETGRRVAASIAGFGYAVVVLAFVRYAVAASRPLLSVQAIVGLSVLVAVGTYSWSWARTSGT